MVLGYTTNGTLPPDAIDADAITAQLEEFNDRLLAILLDGQGFAQWCAAVLTDDNREAGRLVCTQPAIPVQYAEDGVTPVAPAIPARVGPMTAGQLAALRERVALVGKLAKLLNEPIGNASQSLAAQILARRTRWQRRG